MNPHQLPNPKYSAPWVLFALTGATMMAFAANSILGRAALRPVDQSDRLIDPSSYTTIRIASGALVLFFIQCWRKKSTFAGLSKIRSWLSPLMLVIYAAGFSFAYVQLDTASGTLILFAFVQLTMISIGIVKGEVPRGLEIAGLTLASAGLVYLVLPNLQTPLIWESILMAVAGIGWGTYSFLGKMSRDSISSTAFNFILATPIVILFSWLLRNDIILTKTGVTLAIVSGGIASGMGYVLWYLVLPFLRSTQAAVIQLIVPILAAMGGVIFVGDQLGLRTVLAGLAILTGIGLTIKWRKKNPRAENDKSNHEGTNT